MNKFDIEILETLSEVVSVEAETLQEAIDIVNQQYDQEEIVLDASNFIGVEFIDCDSEN